MKKKLVVVWLFGLLALVLTGCGEKQAAEPEKAAESLAMQVTQVAGLLADESQGEASGAEVEQAYFYYYNDTDYLLCGIDNTQGGRQSKLFRMAAGAEPELLLTWPEDSRYDYGDFINSYYLPDSQKLVLYNETQHDFLVYDNITGQAAEFTAPAAAGLKRDDQAFWLDDGLYICCRLEQDPKELQRVSQTVSLYDEKTGREIKLADIGNVWSYLVPPTAQKPDHFRLLGAYGDLLEIELRPNGEVGVWQRRCDTEWPTAVPWLHYISAMPVQKAAGDYLVLEVGCEDGRHYQIVDWTGGVLGECRREDDNGSLLAAYGDTIYFSEYYAPGSQDACQVVAYNFVDNTREVIFGTAQDGLQELYPGLWEFKRGAISPDGSRLLLLADDYVVSLPLAATADD